MLALVDNPKSDKNVQPNKEECMAGNSGPEEGVKGVVEGAKGKVKELSLIHI